MKQMIRTLPPNYPVETVFINGLSVNNLVFTNINSDTGNVYFIDEEDQVIIIELLKIDGIVFGTATGGEGEAYEDCCYQFERC